MFLKIFYIILLGTLIGSITSCSVQLFLYLVNFLSLQFRDLNLNYSSLNELNFPQIKFIFYIIFVPTIVGFLIGRIRNLTDGKRWHGPPDVILSAHTKNSPLNIKTGFLTSFSSVLSISVGGSVGQYGPLVHFGATIGAEIRNYFKDILDYQIFLGAGVAAAISSGFGAPLAGLIFAREVILRHQSLASFSPILVSSLVAYYVTKTFFGIEPILPDSIGGLNSLRDFPAIIFLGLISGMIAVIYMKGLTHKKFFPDISFIRPTFQPALAGLICGIFSFFLPEVTGLGTSTIQNILSENMTINLVIFLLFFKFILTIICIRMGLIGGVFAPALFLGACTGFIFGYVYYMIFPDSNIALFAIAAMSAVGSCVIGGPMANMMIIFELSSDYQVTLAAGLCIVFASIISGKIIGQSVFDRVLLNRNIDLDIGDENLRLENLKIKSIAHQDFCLLKPNQTINDTIKLLAKKKFSEGYIINEEKILINKVLLSDLLNFKNKEKQIKILPRKRFLKVQSDESILNSIDLCKDFVGESIPIVNSYKLVGVIGESDLLKIILKVNNERRETEHKS